MTWDSHRESTEKRRFVEERLKRPPVVAVGMIFLAMWLSGWGCSAFLLARGMASIPARYAISTLVSYGVFIGAVGVWCRQATNPVDRNDHTGSMLDGVGDIPSADSEGCLMVLAIVAVALLLSGIFWFVGGYAMLFEVAFEVAFAGTMVCRLGKRHTLGNWAGALVRRTWVPALVMGSVLVAMGGKMQHDHPEALTLAQAFEARQAMRR